MFERIFLKEQLKKKEYQKKQQRENEEKSQHSNRDNSQVEPNIPEQHKVRGRRRRRRRPRTSPVDVE